MKRIQVFFNDTSDYLDITMPHIPRIGETIYLYQGDSVKETEVETRYKVVEVVYAIHIEDGKLEVQDIISVYVETLE